MNQADFFHFLEVGHVHWVFSSTDDDTKIHHMMTPWIYQSNLCLFLDFNIVAHGSFWSKHARFM